MLLTQSPLLARNTLLNLAGYGAPMLVALFATPLILSSLGTARFGLLTLTWMLIGYLSLLDLGLGRALTKLVAEKLVNGSTEEIPCMIWTALFVMVVLSIVMSTVLGFWSESIVHDLLNIPSELREEAYLSFRLLTIFFPAVMISVGFRGILEAYQRFDMVNAVRIPLGVFSFAIPLAVIPFTTNLPAIIIAFLIVRLLATAAQFFFCYRIVSGLFAGFSVQPGVFGKLMRFGGWITISNVVNPILAYADRFFIGSFLSVTAVAFYATPSEAITRLTLVSAALVSVMFPAFSASFTVDRSHSAFLFDRSLKYVFIAIFPVVFLLVCFAYEGLRIWLNDEFAQASFRVCQLLAAGVFFSCLGQIPYVFIQGSGRPDLTGKLQLFELPVYILLLIPTIQWAGIKGAALLWASRAMVDTTILYFMAQKQLGNDKLQTLPKLFWLLSALILLGGFAIIDSLGLRIVGAVIILVFFVWASLRHLLTSKEVVFLKRMIRSSPEG